MAFYLTLQLCSNFFIEKQKIFILRIILNAFICSKVFFSTNEKFIYLIVFGILIKNEEIKVSIDPLSNKLKIYHSFSNIVNMYQVET